MTTALGKSEGEAAFWTSKQPTWGKLASVGKKPDKFAKEVKVRLRRLDSVVDELKLPPPALIKMDVEGSEIDVLEGARQTLERYRPTLLIEAHGTNAAIENFLVAIGYRVGVLGKNIPVAEAYWNAHIFGICRSSESSTDFRRSSGASRRDPGVHHFSQRRRIADAEPR